MPNHIEPLCHNILPLALLSLSCLGGSSLIINKINYSLFLTLRTLLTKGHLWHPQATHLYMINLFGVVSFHQSIGHFHLANLGHSQFVDLFYSYSLGHSQLKKGGSSPYIVYPSNDSNSRKNFQHAN